MQTQKSGAEQKYFTTFQTIARVTKEEGVRMYLKILIAFMQKYFSFSGYIAVFRPRCAQWRSRMLSHLGFMEL